MRRSVYSLVQFCRRAYLRWVEGTKRRPELRARVADPATGGPYRVDSVGRLLIENWVAENPE